MKTLDSGSSRWRNLARVLVRPVSKDKRALLDQRWQELPEELRTGNQAVGRQLSHCGFTLGASYCSFGCSHCYLPRNANQVPVPSLDEMKAQIDANRELLGENGALQITGGDVLDAYWREDRIDELIEIVRYANSSGTVPMLMTHGQVLLDEPAVLVRLAEEGGLRKLAIHVDITQAGRPGYPIKELRRERDLHPVRQRFVDLLHDVRVRTGLRVSAAHTVTVTAANVDSIGDIVDWYFDDPRRLEVMGLLSLQTEADVGRTRMGESSVSPEHVWQVVSDAIGLDLARETFAFGHPSCSSQALVARLPSPQKHLVDLLPAGLPTERFVETLLRTFGGVGSRGNDSLVANLQRLSLLARSPSMLWRTLDMLRHIQRSSGLSLFRLVGGGAQAMRRGAVLNLVQHNFMDAATIAEGSEETATRLTACSFRGAVRENGAWRAVPMCEVNAGPREDLYSLQISRAKVKAQVG